MTYQLFSWFPTHVGIVGKETIDKVAKAAVADGIID